MICPNHVARRKRHWNSFSVPVLFAATCALTPAIASSSSAAVSQWDDGFAALQREQAELAAINFRLTTANDALCGAHAPQTGMVVQDWLQYSPDIRMEAAHFFNLEQGPSIMVVVPESPAARAGLEVADILVAINGKAVHADPLAGTGHERSASYAGMRLLAERLDAAFSKGPAVISVKRGDAILDLAITPRSGCASRAELLLSGRRNSYADGTSATITTAMTEYARDADELAVVLSHETAHNILRHRFAGKPGQADAGSSTARSRKAEREADYLGLYMMARAGYDIRKAPAFWARFGKDHGLGMFAAPTHPGWAKRARQAQATAGEIEGKRIHNVPLIPDLPAFMASAAE